MLAIRYSSAAQRALHKHRNHAERLRSKIRAYAADPASQANNVKRLSGDPVRYRLRVGDFRVVFDVADGVMWVLDIGPRGSIYE